jgi:hypothetical protein
LETLQTLLIEKKDLIEKKELKEKERSSQGKRQKTKKNKKCWEMFFGGSSQEKPLVEGSQEILEDLKFLDLLKDFATTNKTTNIWKWQATELAEKSRSLE